MKSKQNVRKLEFKKETVARLEGGTLEEIKGGQGTENDVRTTPGNTCTCFTNASEMHCEN